MEYKPPVPVRKITEVQSENNCRVFLDVMIGTAKMGRITIELFDKVAPLATENFRSLCVGDDFSQDGRRLHFKNCLFHYIVPGFACFSGDIENDDGTGGQSIYGVISRRMEAWVT